MNKKLLLTIGSVAAVAAPLAAVVSCGSDDSETGYGLEDGYLDVGMEVNYAPYNFMLTTEQYNGLSEAQKTKFEEYVTPINGGYAAGYDIYVSNHIADILDVEVAIHKMEFDALIPSMINKDQLDAIIAGMTDTAERREHIQFSDSYLDGGLGVLYKTGTTAPTALTDVHGDIYAQTGTTHLELAKTLGTGHGVDDMPQVIANVGKGHFGITDDPTGELQAAMHNDIEYVNSNTINPTGEVGQNNIGLPKATSQEIVDQINTFIGTIDQAAVLAVAAELANIAGA